MSYPFPKDVKSVEMAEEGFVFPPLHTGEFSPSRRLKRSSVFLCTVTSKQHRQPQPFRHGSMVVLS